MHPPIIAPEGRVVANARSIFVALLALVSAARADPAADPAGFPALGAASLVYVLVPDPLGAGTWAEREVGAMRLGVGALREDARDAASAVLSLPATPPSSDYALAGPDATPSERLPRAPDALPGDITQPAFEERRLVGALEAMGLSPEDLVEAGEMPAVALVVIDLLARVDEMLLKRPRDDGIDVRSLRIDPEVRYPKQPRYLRHKKPPEDDKPETPNITLHAKKITRSIYKILLGLAIGVLIWGFVRNSA